MRRERSGKTRIWCFLMISSSSASHWLVGMRHKSENVQNFRVNDSLIAFDENFFEKGKEAATNRDRSHERADVSETRRATRVNDILVNDTDLGDKWTTTLLARERAAERCLPIINDDDPIREIYANPPLARLLNIWKSFHESLKVAQHYQWVQVPVFLLE